MDYEYYTQDTDQKSVFSQYYHFVAFHYEYMLST